MRVEASPRFRFDFDQSLIVLEIEVEGSFFRDEGWGLSFGLEDMTSTSLSSASEAWFLGGRLGCEEEDLRDVVLVGLGGLLDAETKGEYDEEAAFFFLNGNPRGFCLKASGAIMIGD